MTACRAAWRGVLATPGFQFGHWGVLVIDRKTGQTIYEHNADRFFAPASVTKLFSTAAALVELGPTTGSKHHWSVAGRSTPRERSTAT